MTDLRTPAGGGRRSLEWARDHAKSPFMREIAALAVARRMSASEIARRLGLKHVSTIANHLRSESPRQATIDDYCRLFGIEAGYRNLLLGEHFDDDQLALHEHMVLTMTGVNHFEPAFVEEIRAEWERDPQFRRRCIEGHTLASYRMGASYFRADETPAPLDAEIIPGVRFAPPEAALLRAVMERIDLNKFRRKPKAVDDVLAKTAFDFYKLVTGQQLDAILEVARAMLLMNGHDLTFAEQRLSNQLATLRHLFPENSKSGRAAT